jgi:hypothetical protein
MCEKKKANLFFKKAHPYSNFSRCAFIKAYESIAFSPSTVTGRRAHFSEDSKYWDTAV